MKSQHEHILTSSFFLWFENRLLSDDVKAYTTGNANNFKPIIANDVPSNYVTYQGEFRQLVAEEDVDVPNSGIFVDGNFITGDYDQSNIYIDYYKGRVILPIASGDALDITANSTVKEVNTYMTSEGDEDIIFKSQFIEQGQTDNYLYNSQPNELNKNIFVLPACFISLASSQNRELCFGGEEETTVKIKVMVVATDNYYLDGILGSFKDTERLYFQLIDFHAFPYGQFFSLKSFPYNYASLVQSQPSLSENYSSIKKVRTSKLTNGVQHESLGFGLKIGYIEFDITNHRFPRTSTSLLGTDDSVFLEIV